MNVKLKVTPWKGDHASTIEDCSVLLVRGVELDGEELRARAVTFSLSGSPYRGFQEITEDGYMIGEGVISDFLCLSVEGMQPEQYDRLTDNQRAYQSTPERAGIIVSSFEIEIVNG